MTTTLKKFISRFLTKSTTSSGTSTSKASGEAIQMFPIAARRTSPYDIRVGAVVQYDKLRGYGFIKQAEGADAFVHHTAIVSGGFRSLEQGQTVRYVLRETPKGPQAQNVIVIHNAARLAA